ncbi:MAG: Transcriptional regulator, AcrR family [uncultured Acidimicrobiales bacterium]|uniref:Transcriptional regulator, AcrR family n=1 Tax=uncultured Acidimicrobiales bacterium TaxID=310071 RepID=A0A6J4HAE4_9ACTN|nr:MAG: Transcriptional regulator, AcrR family [uncultured Acidimicrobiales bacterium]
MGAVKGSTYRSNIRRGDAPRLVVAAARQLFSTKGYAATSIDEIAAEAGVARPTVFTAVGPKHVILKRVIDHALAGDDAPFAVADRPWFREALEEPEPARSLQLHARNLCWIAQRVGPLLRALEAAAAVDPQAAALWAEHQGQRREGMAIFAAALAAKTQLRVDEATVTDTLWALQPATYLRLVEDGGWSVDRYQRWLSDLFQRLFLQ